MQYELNLIIESKCAFSFFTLFGKYQILIPDGTLNILRVLMAFRRNEYQKYFPRRKGGQLIGLMTLPPSRDDCLAIVGVSTSGPV
jgi:hypothetical protein